MDMKQFDPKLMTKDQLQVLIDDYFIEMDELLALIRTAIALRYPAKRLVGSR